MDALRLSIALRRYKKHRLVPGLGPGARAKPVARGLGPGAFGPGRPQAKAGARNTARSASCAAPPLGMPSLTAAPTYEVGECNMDLS